MSNKQMLFLILKEHYGEFLSGEQLAEQLHISRNAVWKAMRTLRNEGLPIEAVTNHGYRLRAGLKQKDDKITETSILHYLKQDSLVTSVTVLEETGSTNKVVKELAGKGAPEGTLVIAKKQSAGHGRLSRQFFSPEGGIYLSLLLRPELPSERSVLLTTSAAVSVAKAIEKEIILCKGEPDKKHPVQIKWVNDLFLKGKKICGILTEGSFSIENGKLSYAVLGIGINISKVSLAEDLTDIVGFVQDSCPEPVQKNRLIASIINIFSDLYSELSKASYMDEYRDRSMLLGKKLTVLDEKGNYPAIALDIDREGRLIVEHDGKRLSLQYGEVSVKKEITRRTP